MGACEQMKTAFLLTAGCEGWACSPGVGRFSRHACVTPFHAAVLAFPNDAAYVPYSRLLHERRDARPYLYLLNSRPGCFREPTFSNAQPATQVSFHPYVRNELHHSDRPPFRRSVETSPGTRAAASPRRQASCPTLPPLLVPPLPIVGRCTASQRLPGPPSLCHCPHRPILPHPWRQAGARRVPLPSPPPRLGGCSIAVAAVGAWPAPGAPPCRRPCGSSDGRRRRAGRKSRVATAPVVAAT